MRFRQFLLERVKSSGDFKIKPLSAKDAIAWIEKNSHNYFDRAKEAGQQIWRGSDVEAIIGYKNTNDFTRSSANTYNLYTLWMDNHKQWKGYPKRSKSIICTTSDDTASGYGNTHMIIPADKALVGLCPESDLWQSFHTLSSDGGNYVDTTLDQFMSLCMYALHDQMGFGEGPIQLHWDKLEYALKQTRLDALKVSKNWKIGNPAENELIFWLKEFGPSLYDVFLEVLEPQRNRFEVKKAGDYHGHHDQEVWIQGEIIILNFDDIKREINDEAKQMNEFLNEHGIYP